MNKFWQWINKGESDECWEWTGTKTLDGYGSFYDGNKPIMAHRHMWEIANGPIPEGMFVCHHCDNPPCQNPKHLFLGTPTDNMVDMTLKGRGRPYHPRGIKNGRSKLVPDDVREIRRLYSTGQISQDLIAKMFKVAQSTVSYVIGRQRWSSLGE